MHLHELLSSLEDDKLLDFTSAVQHMKHLINNFTFIPYGLLTTHKWPAPNASVFIAELVRASPRYRKVTGSNPVEVLNFSGFYIHNCINCVHNCEDHSLLDFISAVQYMKYFIYNFTFTPHGLLSTHKWPAPNISVFIAQLVKALHQYWRSQA